MSSPPSLPPYETIALVLQGGGALGAYQAGVFEGLFEAGIVPTALSGISIGALNIAIIAGNPPENRVARLREFWQTICQPPCGTLFNNWVEQSLFNVNDAARQLLGAWHAGSAIVNGQNGFFRPRMPPPALLGQGDPAQTGYYDMRELKDTLQRLCDFDRINAGDMAVSIGAVNVRSGNFTYFDNRRIRLRAEHFMASGALPPAFPAVEIDGEYFWDGGLVSNTPLANVLSAEPQRDTLVFQVDLWSARGCVPGNMGEVADRIKEIRYSSRTRLITEHMRRAQYTRHLMQRLIDAIPASERADNPWCQLAQELACVKRYNVIHLIYRNRPYERDYKDFQFGLASMREHWDSGLSDIRLTLQDPGRLAMPENPSGFVTHDAHRESFPTDAPAQITRPAPPPFPPVAAP